MFFVGSDGEPADESFEPPRTVPDARQLDPKSLPIPSIDQAAVRLTPGARVGQPIDEPRRSGFPEEILVTLHSDPRQAAQVALEQGVLDGSPRQLLIDTASLRARRNELVWSATLRTWPWAGRPARLRLYGSPSANVTVLTLTPLHPHRVATRSFLRVGMRTMTELRDRLARDITPP